jgi:UDP-3-O-[3-hydroxymyristoyl] glucosamine N-acyltransferase
MPHLQEIIDFLKPICVIGSSHGVIEELVRLDSLSDREDVLFWCKDSKLPDLESAKGGTVLCGVAAQGTALNSLLNYIVVPNPRLAFLRVASHFFAEPDEPAGVHPSATIDPTVTLGSNVKIGPNVVIERECSIGDGSCIGPNTVIHRRTQIGKDVKIGANNTIGGVGFGYEPNDEGVYEVIPHLGNVVIEDRVEIGNNTTVDRAVLGSTFLRADAKIDNLVHVAHGVTVGRNSLLIAHSMIGGSTHIGESVWVAPTAAILNGVKIGSDSVIGMGAVVLKTVEAGDIMIGNPARRLRNKYAPKE